MSTQVWQPLLPDENGNKLCDRKRKSEDDGGVVAKVSKEFQAPGTVMEVVDVIDAKQLPMNFPLCAALLPNNCILVSNSGRPSKIQLYCPKQKRTLPIESCPIFQQASAIATNEKDLAYVLDDKKIHSFKIFNDKLRYQKTFAETSINRRKAFGLTFNHKNQEVVTLVEEFKGRGHSSYQALIFDANGNYKKFVNFNSASGLQMKFLSHLPDSNVLFASDMKQGNPHSLDCSRGQSKILNTATTKAIGAGSNNKKDGFIKKPAGVCIDKNGWAIVSDIGSAELFVLDETSKYVGKVHLKSDSGDDIDKSDISDLWFDSEHNKLVMSKYSSTNSQVGVFKLEMPSEACKKFDFKAAMIYHGNPDKDHIVAKCIHYLGGEKQLASKFKAVFVEKESTLFVTNTGRNNILAYNMEKGKVDVLPFVGSKDPFSTVIVDDKVFVADKNGVHSFTLKPGLKYLGKQVSFQEEPAGLGYIKQAGQKYLYTLLPKKSSLWTLNLKTLATKVVKIDDSTTLNCGMVASQNKEIKSDLVSLITTCQYNQSVQKIDFNFGNNAPSNVKVTQVFSNKQEKDSYAFKPYPRFNQIAGLAANENGQLLITDSKGKTMHSFDQSQRYLGRVDIKNRGANEQIRFGGLTYNFKEKKFVTTSVDRDNNKVIVMKLK